MKKEQIKVILLGLFIVVVFISGFIAFEKIRQLKNEAAKLNQLIKQKDVQMKTLNLLVGNDATIGGKLSASNLSATDNIAAKCLNLSGGWIYSTDPLGGAIQLASTNVIHFQGNCDDQRTVFRIMPKGRQGFVSSSLELFGTDFNKDGANWERFILMANFGPAYMFCTEKSGNQTAKPMVFSAGNRTNNNMYLGTNGYVGIFRGKSAPAYPLDVGGDAHFRRAVTISGPATINAMLKLTPMSAPSAPTEGMIYLNSSDHHLYFYNGSEWKRLD